MSVYSKWKHNVECLIRPDEEWGVPTRRKVDSLARAARRGSGSGGAIEDASVGARRSGGGSAAAAGVLGSDEGRGEGKNGESGEAEHSVGFWG